MNNNRSRRCRPRSAATILRAHGPSLILPKRQRFSARCGASPGHFDADASKREFGIQIEATCQSTQTTTVHELLVPIRALTTPRRAPSLPCRRVNVGYEPFLGRRLAHASRRAAEHQSAVSSDKLPVGLRDVGARQLRFAVCSGALLVFEVCPPAGGIFLANEQR